MYTCYDWHLIILTTWLYIWFWYKISLLIRVWYVEYPMIHMTWLDIYFCYWLPLLLFIYVAYYFSLIPVYIFIICSHVICMCTFHFMLTHSLGVWLPEFAYPDLWLFIVDQIFREDHRHLEELEFSWLAILSRYSLSLLYSYCFHDSMNWTHYLFYSFIHMISCVNIYMYRCSVIILSWWLYSLLRLL